MKKGILSALSLITGVAAGAAASAAAVGKKAEEKLNSAKSMSDKHLALYLLMNQWVRVKQEGKNLASYLTENGYKKIAIYGMNYVGETLLNELKESDIQIAYAIDKNADGICVDVDVISVDDKLEEVDAIVVTAITFFEEIEEKLKTKVECPIISLEDILYGV